MFRGSAPDPAKSATCAIFKKLRRRNGCRWPSRSCGPREASSTAEGSLSELGAGGRIERVGESLNPCWILLESLTCCKRNTRIEPAGRSRVRGTASDSAKVHLKRRRKLEVFQARRHGGQGNIRSSLYIRSQSTIPYGQRNYTLRQGGDVSLSGASA